MNDIENFVENQLDTNIGGVTPINNEEYIQFRIIVKELSSIIDKNQDLSKKLNILYKNVRSRMIGFPKFYEIEDIFLEIIDDGYFVGYEFLYHNLTIDITKGGLNIMEYNDVLLKCNKLLIPRLKSLFNNNVKISDSEYDKRESNIRIELTIK